MVGTALHALLCTGTHLECRQSDRSTKSHRDAGICTHMTFRLWLLTAAVEDRRPAHAPQVSQGVNKIFNSLSSAGHSAALAAGVWQLHAMFYKVQVCSVASDAH